MLMLLFVPRGWVKSMISVPLRESGTMRLGAISANAAPLPSKADNRPAVKSLLNLVKLPSLFMQSHGDVAAPCLTGSCMAHEKQAMHTQFVVATVGV